MKRPAELPVKPVQIVPVRPYLGESAKDRIKDRRQRLLDTAFGLLADNGWREVTIDKLCRKAKLNKRYFYESFANLDELAAAVVDDLSAGLVTTGYAAARAARAAGLPTDELAYKSIEAVIRYVTDDPRRARVLFEEIADNPQARKHRKAVIKGLSAALSAYGHEHHNTVSTDPISDLASTVLIGGSIEVVVNWLDGNIQMSRDQLIADLAALWVITGDGAADRARKREKPSSAAGVPVPIATQKRRKTK